MGKVVAIFNQKGGVGKTSSISCLAAELHARGKKVLVIDADQQENLSVSLKVIPSNCLITIYDLLRKAIEDDAFDRDLAEAIHHTEAGYDLIVGSVRMAGMDRQMLSVTQHETRLDTFLVNYAEDNKGLRDKIEAAGLTEDTKEYLREKKRFEDKTAKYKEKIIDAGLYREIDGDFILREILEPIRNSYDYILIDCPPALSSVTINILTAADRLIIPMTPEPFSAAGMTNLTANVEVVRRLNNPELKISGLLFTMVERRKVGNALIKATRDRYKGQMYIYNTMIPRSTDVNKSFALREPLIAYKKDNIARIAYSNFCDEFLEREEN